MVEGLSHITLVVESLDRTTDLLRRVLDAREVYSSGDRPFSIAREKFFLVGGVWVAIMEGARVAERSYRHVAFKVPDAELDGYVERIRALGLEFKVPRARVEGEGRSVYFYDYDDHLFELHAGTLEQRLARYRRER
jgi:catechol 2,3-dioxygenase-like lactoylglutathione lyase family enzyme